VAPWNTILSWHTLFTMCSDLQIYSGVIFCEARHHTQAHVTRGALILFALSLAMRWTDTAAEFDGWFHWSLLVMGTLQLHNIYCSHTSSSNHSRGGMILAFSSFFNPTQSIHLPMKMEPTVSSEMSAVRTHTPGNYPKRNKFHLEHGRSLKTRIFQSNLSPEGAWNLGGHI